MTDEEFNTIYIREKAKYYADKYGVGAYVYCLKQIDILNEKPYLYRDHEKRIAQCNIWRKILDNLEVFL